jgi:hypothetical protein
MTLSDTSDKSLAAFSRTARGLKLGSRFVRWVINPVLLLFIVEGNLSPCDDHNRKVPLNIAYVILIIESDMCNEWQQNGRRHDQRSARHSLELVSTHAKTVNHSDPAKKTIGNHAYCFAQMVK